MKIQLRYGNDERSLLVPTGTSVDFVLPREVTPIADLSHAVTAACDVPVDSESLAAKAKSASKILLVVSDPTRGGTEVVLPHIVGYLAAAGVEPGNVRILVARGTHRKLSKDEKQFFRSPELLGIRVEEHDCDASDKLSALLLTRRGTPVRINRQLRDADLAILVSPVSFHYFAGFGGGRKLVLPGCADRPAIVANHRLSLVNETPSRLHPACRPGSTDGNPVHEDMMETASTLDQLFSINYLCDADGAVIFFNAGHWRHAHQEACTACSEINEIETAAPASVIVVSAGGAPYDMNLIQTHKALAHAARVSSDNASILCYAACPEGIGSESLERALNIDLDTFLDSASLDYSLNNQTAVSLRTLTRRCRVSMVTELSDETLSAAGIARCDNAEAFLAESLDARNADRICVIPHGNLTLPTVKGR